MKEEKENMETIAEKLGWKAKDLIVTMHQTVNRLPDKQDFADAFTPLLAEIPPAYVRLANLLKYASHFYTCDFTRGEREKDCSCGLGKIKEEILREAEQAKPRVVCLCGSTRFYDEFQKQNYLETMAGRIILSVGFYPHVPAGVTHSEEFGCSREQKIALDALHKKKIDLADEVFVLNVGGYIDESTRSEIQHAVAKGKPVRYLEPMLDDFRRAIHEAAQSRLELCSAAADTRGYPCLLLKGHKGPHAGEDREGIFNWRDKK